MALGRFAREGLGLVARLRREGRSVLFISFELEELVRSCQRVVVLRDRQRIAELAGAAIEQGRILQTIARQRPEA